MQPLECVGEILDEVASHNALFFPASGYRFYSSGTLNYVGSFGYYWSASPQGISDGHNLLFNSGIWRWDDDYRALGCPVRAVAEE